MSTISLVLGNEKEKKKEAKYKNAGVKNIRWYFCCSDDIGWGGTNSETISY